MPSFSQAITDGRIIILVAVSQGPGQPSLVYRALLDTGAMVTAIAPKVVQDLQFLPTGQLTLSVASGHSVDTFQYHARVDIPIQYDEAAAPARGTGRFLMGNQLLVAGLPYQPDDYDVILGMDFIGMFHITMYNHSIIMSN